MLPLLSKYSLRAYLRLALPRFATMVTIPATAANTPAVAVITVVRFFLFVTKSLTSLNFLSIFLLYHKQFGGAILFIYFNKSVDFHKRYRYDSNMNKEPQLNDSFYLVRIGHNHMSTHLDNDEGYVDVHKSVQLAQVMQIFVNAITHVETTEASAKYFFNVKTQYHYSDKIDGVATEYSYFTLGGNVDGAYGVANTSGCVMKTFAEAQKLAFEWDKSQAEFAKEREDEIVANFEHAIKKIRGEK